MESSPTRPYRKRARARKEAETRRRITEAVVELHRTVGPARTTVTDVAERAGVSRMTVYNHFPTEADLIEACSTHWSARHPPPAPSSWAHAPPGPERLRAALEALYRWYRATEDMMGKILRDAPIVTPLGALMDDRWEPYVDEIVRGLVTDWPGPGAPPGPRAGTTAGAAAPERDALVAAVRLAVDFHTWQVLTRSGRDDAGAAALAARMAAAADGSRAVRAGP